MNSSFLLCFTVIICALPYKDAVAAPKPKITDLLFNVNTGLTEMMKVAKAVREKDYIQALLILIDMDLKSVKNHTSALTFSLEESQPALKLLRKTIQVFRPSEESEYYNTKFNEKLKIVISNWKDSLRDSIDILKRYVKIFIADVKSGKLKEKVVAFFKKMIEIVKSVFHMFFKKRRH